MNLLDSMEPWAEPKRNKLFDYLRIILGVFIVYKGVTFTQDITALQEMSETVNVMLAAFLSSYVTTVHMIGGALLVFGLFTRWMCLIQIPILLGAVFLVNFPKGFLSMAGNIEFGTSIIVLIGLVFFFFMGAGANSIDAMRRRDKQRLEDAANH
jgi:putative oxidoreductase